MAKRITWKKRLLPFGDLIYQMASLVGELTPRDLLQLENACKKVSTTNIGWGSYEAAAIVGKLARDERYRRKQIAALGKRDE